MMYCIELPVVRCLYLSLERRLRVDVNVDGSRDVCSLVILTGERCSGSSAIAQGGIQITYDVATSSA